MTRPAPALEPHVLTVAAGDVNMTLRAFTDAILPNGKHPDVRIDGHGVDSLAAFGARRLDLRNLGRHGSDAHDVLLFDLTAAPSGRAVRIMVWNPWVGQHPETVRRELAELTVWSKPDAVVLSEAYRLHGVLQRIPDYDVHQGKPGHRGGPEAERADVAILVRRDHPIVGAGTLRMGQWWRFRDNRKAARRYPWVRIELAPDQQLRLLGLHYPWGHKAGANMPSVKESLRRTRRWIRQPERAARRRKARR